MIAAHNHVLLHYFLMTDKSVCSVFQAMAIPLMVWGRTGDDKEHGTKRNSYIVNNM